jgi:MFS family permease
MTLGAAFGLGQGVMFTFFPTYALDLGVRWVGLFAVTYSGAALGVRATASGLADTIGRRAVIIPALALQAGATVLLSSLGLLARSLGFPAGPSLALAGLLAGAAHGLLYPALTALVVDVTPPERRGRVVGVFMAFILLGQAGGAAGFGHLAHAVGYGPMFGILSILLAGACVLAFRLER